MALDLDLQNKCGRETASRKNTGSRGKPCECETYIPIEVGRALTRGSCECRNGHEVHTFARGINPKKITKTGKQSSPRKKKRALDEKANEGKTNR